MNSETQTSPSDIGAIIVNYNAGPLLADCVARALSEVDRVVVIDNESHDDSLRILESQLSSSDRVDIIKNGSNLGFAAACNIGAKRFTSHSLLFLNPDSLIEPGSLVILQQVLYSDHDIGMVGGLLLNADGTEQAGGRRAIPTPWRSFVRAFGLGYLSQRWPKLFSDYNLHKQPLPVRPIEVEAISGACMLVKRDAVQEVGLWDENYFLHCEDLDWCMRFRQKGWKIMFVPSARVVHLHGACSKNRKLFVEWHKHKGMLRFYNKFFRHQYPGILMWLVVLGVAMRFGLILIANFGGKVLRGLGLARV